MPNSFVDYYLAYSFLLSVSAKTQRFIAFPVVYD